MHHRTFSLVGAAFALVLMSSSTPAHAQSDATRARARKLAYEGQDALDRKDYATAADRFAQADEAVHAPTLVLGLAHADVGLGKLLAARELYQRIIREGVPPKSPPAFAKALEDSKQELAQLETRIPKITIRVRGASTAPVTIDGKPVEGNGPIQVDPGQHVVRASADLMTPAEVTVEVAESETKPVELELRPAAPAGPVAPPPEGSSARRTATVVTFAAGGAALALGLVTGGIAIGQHGSLEKSCPTGRCVDPSTSSELSTYHTVGALSTVGFVAAGVLGGAGVVLLLTAPKKKDDASPPSPNATQLSVGPGAVSISRRF